MVKKRKTNTKPVAKQKKDVGAKTFFMGLSRSQARSLALGIVVAGIGLFILAGITWQNKGKLQTSIFPTTAPTITSQPSQMISATSTAQLTHPTPVVKKLPNTTSKVTYTVQEDDNLAEVGEKVCGSNRAWLSIVKTNNISYPYVIYPGETYIITCK